MTAGFGRRASGRRGMRRRRQAPPTVAGTSAVEEDSPTTQVRSPNSPPSRGNRKLKKQKRSSSTPAPADGSLARLLERCKLPILQLFRCIFFLVMAYNWSKHGIIPCNDWQQTFKYYHTTDVCPPDEWWTNVARSGGVLTCLLAVFFNPATVAFAIPQNVYVFSYITNFVNHDYLFGLMAVLMVLLVYATGDRKLAWTQALRGQICVVYFYAALWKLITPAWLDGTIVRGIFISFEAQGVASGVPWSQLEKHIPHLFTFVAWSGLFLDALLAAVLFFGPIGHWTQQVGVVFHGFTAFTMAQRIGYAFPTTMLASGLLFLPVDGDEETYRAGGHSSKSTTERGYMSHASWMKHHWSRFPFVTLWLLVQWLMPARMPIVSRGQYKYTREAYRFSWTMMMHSAESLSKAGDNFLTLRLYCGNALWNMQPVIPQDPNHFDTSGYPIHRHIGVRGLAALNMFPRQLPAIGNEVAKEFDKLGFCKHQDGVAVYGTMFQAVDGSPIFQRVIDPTQNLVTTHKTLKERGFFDTLVGSFLDKAPSDVEFLLQNVGSYAESNPVWKSEKKKLNSELNIPNTDDEWIYIIDRLPCLAADPISIFTKSIEFVVITSPEPLMMEWCKDLKQTECVKKKISWDMSKPQKPTIIPPMAVIKFHCLEEKYDQQLHLDQSCQSSTEEDVVIKYRAAPQKFDLQSVTISSRTQHQAKEQNMMSSPKIQAALEKAQKYPRAMAALQEVRSSSNPSQTLSKYGYDPEIGPVLKELYDAFQFNTKE
ncbi:hypothetical protein ACHAWF_009951 [Thalassiosira exigua]